MAEGDIHMKFRATGRWGGGRRGRRDSAAERCWTAILQPFPVAIGPGSQVSACPLTGSLVPEVVALLTDEPPATFSGTCFLRSCLSPARRAYRRMSDRRPRIV